jgi:hypothetical protein
MDKNNLVKEYISKQKEKCNVFYDVMQKFLELPKERWKTTDPNEFWVMGGDNPNEITEYTAELGPYKIFIRADNSQKDEECIYRIDIEYKEGVTAFHPILSDEAVELYFCVDEMVREVEGSFVNEIYELKDDLEALMNIKEKLDE